MNGLGRGVRFWVELRTHHAGCIARPSSVDCVEVPSELGVATRPWAGTFSRPHQPENLPLLMLWRRHGVGILLDIDIELWGVEAPIRVGDLKDTSCRVARVEPIVRYVPASTLILADEGRDPILSKGGGAEHDERDRSNRTYGIDGHIHPHLLRGERLPSGVI